MDFPARPGERIPVSDEMIAALGAKPTEAYLARDLLTIFPAETAAATLKPNLELVAALDAFAVIASAKGDQVDFHLAILCAARRHPRGPGDRIGALHTYPLLGRPAWQERTHGQAAFRARRRIDLRNQRRPGADCRRRRRIPARRNQFEHCSGQRSRFSLWMIASTLFG